MTVNLVEILEAGGEPRIKMLQFSILSVRMNPIFLYLLREYKVSPSGRRACMLFDLFCGPRAPVPIEVTVGARFQDLRLAAAIEPLRQNLLEHERTRFADPDEVVPLVIPATHLFQDLQRQLLASPQVAELCGQFDPQREVVECLPGGRMTEAQHGFVDRVWKPVIRRHLVEVGFRSMASLG